jgi:hypothetical protein
MPDRVVALRGSNGFEPSNCLLAASFQPHLEAGPLARGSVLFETDEPVTRIYFV